MEKFIESVLGGYESKGRRVEKSVISETIFENHAFKHYFPVLWVIDRVTKEPKVKRHNFRINRIF